MYHYLYESRQDRRGNEEIAEAIMVARQAKAAAIFAASVDGFEELLKDS